MAVSTVNLYDDDTSTTFGTIFFNSSTSAWYSDSSCQNQITTAAVPSKKKYSFDGYRLLNSSTSTLVIDANGNIVYTPTSWTSAATRTLHARWTQISKRFTIDPADYPSGTYTWTPRTTEFFRSLEASTHFYSDYKLQNEITSIQLPYESGKSCAGMYYTLDSVGKVTLVNEDGTFNTSGPIATGTSTTDYILPPHVRMWTCYKMTLNANGGTGGPTDPIWWDRVRNKWCADDIMSQQISGITTLPTRSGYIFNGYYTASSGGTQVIAADGTLGTYSALASSNKTVYAQWASPVTITANHGSGTGTFTNLYYGGGRFFDSSELTTAITSVSVPTLANYKFLGYYSAASGGTQYIDASGNILAAFAPSSACTIYAQYERVSYTITVNHNGGSGIEALYANAAKTAVFDNIQCTGSALSSITPLTKSGYRFMGLYSSDSISGTQLVANTGEFTLAFSSFVAAMGDSAMIYAIWQQVFTITLDGQGGAGSPGEIYYDDTYCQFYDNAAMTTPISSVEKPTRECYEFLGFYDAASGGTQKITAAGAIASGWTPTESSTIYAQWAFKSYKYTLDPSGGMTTQGAIYNGGASGTYYADDQLTITATTVVLPTRSGYTFAGYYNGSTCVVTAAGAISVSSAMSANATAEAQWTANTYTLTFNYDGGSGSVASKSVVFGQEIGTLPTATRTKAIFKGWYIDGNNIQYSTVWDFASDKQATAVWETNFSTAVDYFNLASANLIAESSDSGDTHQHTCAYNATSEAATTETSGIWRNPRVTYRVANQMTLAITLGRAYAKTGTTISGYMISAVEVHTAVGEAPSVTVSAVANEGANAVKTYAVSIPITARHRPQNLLSAISGGGELQELTLVARGDPVVVAENGMPCASDMTHGRIEVSAVTAAYNNESAPTASNNFTKTAEPQIGSGTGYKTFSVTVRKELT